MREIAGKRAQSAGRLDSHGTPLAAGWHAGIKTAKLVIANHLHGCTMMATRRPKWKSWRNDEKAPPTETRGTILARGRGGKMESWLKPNIREVGRAEVSSACFVHGGRFEGTSERWRIEASGGYRGVGQVGWRKAGGVLFRIWGIRSLLHHLGAGQYQCRRGGARGKRRRGGSDQDNCVTYSRRS